MKPFRNHVGGIGLLIHDYGVRKFALKGEGQGGGIETLDGKSIGGLYQTKPITSIRQQSFKASKESFCSTLKSYRVIIQLITY
jgi:hypothetical protein